MIKKAIGKFINFENLSKLKFGKIFYFKEILEKLLIFNGVYESVMVKDYVRKEIVWTKVSLVQIIVLKRGIKRGIELDGFDGLWVYWDIPLRNIECGSWHLWRFAAIIIKIVFKIRG